MVLESSVYSTFGGFKEGGLMRNMALKVHFLPIYSYIFPKETDSLSRVPGWATFITGSCSLISEVGD